MNKPSICLAALTFLVLLAGCDRRTTDKPVDPASPMTTPAQSASAPMGSASAP